MDHRQRGDLLFHPVLVDRKLAGLEVGDELAAGVTHDDIRLHEIDVGGKRRRLWRSGLSSGVFLKRHSAKRDGGRPRGQRDRDRGKQGGCDAHGHKTYMLSGWLRPSPSRAMAAPRPVIW